LVFRLSSIDLLASGFAQNAPFVMKKVEARVFGQEQKRWNALQPQSAARRAAFSGSREPAQGNGAVSAKIVALTRGRGLEGPCAGSMLDEITRSRMPLVIQSTRRRNGAVERFLFFHSEVAIWWRGPRWLNV